jgi:hypothetical protein
MRMSETEFRRLSDFNFKFEVVCDTASDRDQLYAFVDSAQRLHGEAVRARRAECCFAVASVVLLFVAFLLAT